MAAPVVTIADDAPAAAAWGARQFGELARAAIAERGRFTVALAGGRTPRAMYEQLAEPAIAGTIPWAAMDVFWADERCVPPEDLRSNFRMAHEALLSHVGVDAAHVHRIEAERVNPHEAAAAYESLVRESIPPGSHGVPVFDLILLGMGADGHTASLFPGSALLTERDRLVAADWVAQLSDWRVTMTPVLLAAARRLVLLVTGREKAHAVAAVLGGERPSTLPATLVSTSAMLAHWILDRESAQHLLDAHARTPPMT